MGVRTGHGGVCPLPPRETEGFGAQRQEGEGMAGGKVPRPGFFEEGEEGGRTKSSQLLLPTVSATMCPTCPLPRGRPPA